MHSRNYNSNQNTQPAQHNRTGGNNRISVGSANQLTTGDIGPTNMTVKSRADAKHKLGMVSLGQKIKDALEAVGDRAPVSNQLPGSKFSAV